MSFRPVNPKGGHMPPPPIGERVTVNPMWMGGKSEITVKRIMLILKKDLRPYGPTELILSDFVRVKSNVSPRPSTFTYPIFDRATPLTTSIMVFPLSPSSPPFIIYEKKECLDYWEDGAPPASLRVNRAPPPYELSPSVSYLDKIGVYLVEFDFLCETATFFSAAFL